MEIGTRFGRLVVLRKSTKNTNRNIYWECFCDCGNRTIVSTTRLNLGRTKSCGCLKKDVGRNNFISINNARRYSITQSPEIRKIYYRYKKSAIKRKLSFDLSIELFESIITSKCYYCGIDSNKYVGIDRVDNDNGYIISNVVPCCRTCNFCKNTLSRDEFLSIVERIYNNLCLKEKLT